MQDFELTFEMCVHRSLKLGDGRGPGYLIAIGDHLLTGYLTL